MNSLYDVIGNNNLMIH